MSTDKTPKVSEQLRQMRDSLPNRCPLAIDEIIASYSRCELVYDNCDDKVEKYFSREVMGVLRDISAQLLSLASHPNLDQLVDGASNEL